MRPLDRKTPVESVLLVDVFEEDAGEVWKNSALTDDHRTTLFFSERMEMLKSSAGVRGPEDYFFIGFKVSEGGCGHV